jgi:hypothetical protein
MFGNSKRKQAGAVGVAPAPIKLDDDDDVPLDPTWLAGQEAAEVAPERTNGAATDDDQFAQAVWLVQMDEALHESLGGSVSRRIARIVSYGAASGLTGGQLAALKRLADRVDGVRRVVGDAERRRAGGQLSVAGGAGGRNF